MGQRVQVLEGVLAAVIDRALNTDKLPVPVVRLALADAVHAVRELERQQAERRAAQQQAAAEKAKTEDKKAAPAAAEKAKEAKDHGEPNKA